jgi:hypothetical protein
LKNYTLVNFELTNFILYPNPNRNFFSLLVRQSGIKIVIHDVLGRKIFEKAMIQGNYDYHENIQLVIRSQDYTF